MKKEKETAAEIRHRILQHWQIAHGRAKGDPACAACRKLEQQLEKAREREKA